VALYKLATKGQQISAGGYSFEWNKKWTYPEVVDVTASPIPAELQRHIDSGRIVTADATAQTNAATEAAARIQARIIGPQAAETNVGAATATAAAAATAVALPAGGTGTAAGGWDTAVNRDLAIARFAALLADVAAIRTSNNALVTDVAAIRTKLNNLLAKLRTAGVLTP